MPARRGVLLANVDPALTDEQRVFTKCVDDVLASAPGLQYALLAGPEETGDRDTYAVFLIKASSAHDLMLSVELRDRAFVVRLNGKAFARHRGFATRFEWWVERRCRDLEHLITGDLRLVQHTLLGLPISSRLEAGRDTEWHRIAGNENGWLAFMTFLVPYGFLMNGEKTRFYGDWLDLDGENAAKP